MSNERRWSLCIITILSLFLGFLFCKDGCPGAMPFERRDLQYDNVVRYAQQTQKPIFLFFTKKDCSWCTKMKQEVFSQAQVQIALKDYAFGQIDIDAEPEIAKELKIQELPAFIIANPSDLTIQKKKTGYMTAAELLHWMRGQQTKPSQLGPPRRFPANGN